jgi:2-keto-4-pentenoate hydratase/2-oxohepta-3-ene-1,7-dioic acid hydratase in catechol pathway
LDDGTTVPYPPQTANFHHEIELIVAIGQGGTDIPIDHALDHVWGYGVGIDLTRRDLQLQAREQGRPWDWAMALRPGDVIMTGTPEGVGPVQRGEVMTGGIKGLSEIGIAVE